MQRPGAVAQLVAEARGRSVDLVPLAVDPGRSATYLDARTRAVTRVYEPGATAVAVREADALTRAATAELPVPELVDRFEARGRVVLVTGPVAGAPLALVEPDLGPAEQHALLRQLGGLLGRLHAAGLPAAEPPTLMATVVDAARRSLRTDRSLPGSVRPALLSRIDVLAAVAGSMAPVEPTLTHGQPDARHVMVRRTAGRTVITGLVDFSAAGPADPMVDVAAAIFDGLLDGRPRAGVIEGYRTVRDVTALDALRVEMHALAQLATGLADARHPAARVRLNDAASRIVEDRALERALHARRPAGHRARRVHALEAGMRL